MSERNGGDEVGNGTPASRPAPAHAALPIEALRRRTDPATLEIPDQAAESGLLAVGQERAVGALEFGSAIRKPGFNLFAMGPEGVGRHTAVRDYLKARAASEPTPDDWVYVNNFATSNRPRAIQLPPGRAHAFQKAMEAVVNDLAVALPALFDSDEYKARLNAILQEFEDAQEKAFATVNEKAEEKNIVIMRNPMGFGFAPKRDGEVMKPEEFGQLPEAERERIQADIRELQEDLKEALQQMPKLEKDRRDRIRAFGREMATSTVEVEIREVAEQFGEITAVLSFLDEAKADLVDNVDLFIDTEHPPQEQGGPAGLPPAQLIAAQREARLRRYAVNVIVGNHRGDGSGGAPVIYEDNPTAPNLIGRIEHVPQMGALVTDFTLIRPGALHLANGGYLIVDARQLLLQPFAWEALKRSLKNNSVKITTVAEQVSLISTISLAPDPIPLSVKVVLIGDRMLYYLLFGADPDLSELFKVEADFNEVFERSAGNQAAYAGLINRIARNEALRPITRPGLARMLDESARLAEDAERLSLRVGMVADILREADHWAGADGADAIDEDHIARAVAERHHRADRVRERSLEAITRDIILIDTDGAQVGAVNGLAVTQFGNIAFGRPSRITARARMGTGRVIDIEREVELGGPLHSKGVLILSGYLAARYALNVPVSLSATLVFEQSYGGVDGDSASSTELYALLSALSDIPINQSFAVTGSVNQRGEVQAIGGVNEKIEGYFDVCRERGLTGRQGVLIPIANVQHLMLREDVVEACRDGQFAIYPVSTIDQGIEILTGIAAGERRDDGRFPAGTVNQRVETRLSAFAEARRRFHGDDSDGEGRNHGGH